MTACVSRAKSTGRASCGRTSAPGTPTRAVRRAPTVADDADDEARDDARGQQHDQQLPLDAEARPPQTPAAYGWRRRRRLVGRVPRRGCSPRSRRCQCSRCARRRTVHGQSSGSRWRRPKSYACGSGGRPPRPRRARRRGWVGSPPMPSPLPPDIEAQAISLIRGFAMDAPLHAKSGHQGTAMALAPLAHVLYSRVLKHDPADPEWPDRDRFVLSNGHASILQYSMLYLSRLRPRARRHRGVPPVRVAHARPPRGPPHARRRGHDRSARPGLRRRRRHGDRRAGAARALRRRTSSTTTPTSSPATAASWRASATRPPRSPATSGSAG